MKDRTSKEALDEMFWREEILQVLFWMEGEDLVEAVEVSDLQTFLHGDTSVLQHQLRRCCEQGLVCEDESGRFRLTDFGRKRGGELFSDSFAELQKQGHGECSSDCVCFTEGPDNCPLHAHET